MIRQSLDDRVIHESEDVAAIIAFRPCAAPRMMMMMMMIVDEVGRVVSSSAVLYDAVSCGYSPVSAAANEGIVSPMSAILRRMLAYGIQRIQHVPSRLDFHTVHR